MTNSFYRFEALGQLYSKRFRRLRPGKSEAYRDSNEKENVDQFDSYVSTHQALNDALDKIVSLEEKLEGAMEKIEQLQPRDTSTND